MPATIVTLGTPTQRFPYKDPRPQLRRSWRMAAVALLGTVLLAGTTAGEIHSNNKAMEGRHNMFEASTANTAKIRRKSLLVRSTHTSASTQFFVSTEKLSPLAQTEQERQEVENYSEEGISVDDMVQPHGFLRRTERGDEQPKRPDNTVYDSHEFAYTHEPGEETPVEQSSSSTHSTVIVLVLIPVALVLCMAMAIALRRMISEFNTSEIKIKGDFFGWDDGDNPVKTEASEESKFDDENSSTGSCFNDDGSSPSFDGDCTSGRYNGKPARDAEGEHQKTTYPVDVVVGTGRVIAANHLPHKKEGGNKEARNESSYMSSVYKCSDDNSDEEENIGRGGCDRGDITVCNNCGDDECISIAGSQTCVSSLQSCQSARQYYLDRMLKVLGEKRLRQNSQHTGASRSCSSSSISSLPNSIDKSEAKLAAMAATSSRSRSKSKRRQRTVPIVCEDSEEHTESNDTPQANEYDICVHRSEPSQTAPALRTTLSRESTTSEENWPNQCGSSPT